jgi:hypothetical protein
VQTLPPGEPECPKRERKQKGEVSNGGGVERERAETERTNRGSPSLVINSTEAEKVGGKEGSWRIDSSFRRRPAGDLPASGGARAGSRMDPILEGVPQEQERFLGRMES